FLSTAPATPEIYTLSLHDALPISCRCSRQEESVEMIKSASISSALFTFCSAMALDIESNLTANVPPNPQQVSPCRISTSSSPPTDRKSTRLNSSHVKISYAVFCLK